MQVFHRAVGMASPLQCTSHAFGVHVQSHKVHACLHCTTMAVDCRTIIFNGETLQLLFQHGKRHCDTIERIHVSAGCKQAAIPLCKFVVNCGAMHHRMLAGCTV